MATSIIRRRTQLAKTAALQKRMRKTMMRNAPRLFAAARPGALPMPADRKLQALTPASVLDRYGDTAAGVRAVAMGANGRSEERRVGKERVSTGRSRWVCYH